MVMANKHLLLRPCLSGSWGIIGGIGPVTPQKSNIDTKNDGLENVSPFQTWLFWISMLDFREGRFPIPQLQDMIVSSPSLRDSRTVRCLTYLEVLVLRYAVPWQS